MPLTIRRASTRRDDPMLIFVHGIMSKPDTAWGMGTARPWPRIVIDDPALSGCGVAVFDYAARPSDRHFSIDDAAGTLWMQLRDKGLIEAGRVPLFICHSMGGLVVRSMLVSQRDKLRTAGVGLVGTFLVASPTMGSRWATRLLPLTQMLGHQQAMALSSSEDNQWLRRLRNDFLNLVHDGPIRVRGKELVEAQPLRLSKWVWMSRVVLWNDAVAYFPDPQMIARTDHFTIAAPQSAQADQHVALRLFAIDLATEVAGGNCRLPAGIMFSQAAQCVATAWRLNLDLTALTPEEKSVQLETAHELGGANGAVILERLRAIFPPSSIRPYRVSMEEDIATLTIE